METIKVDADPTAEQDLRTALAAEGFDLTHVAPDPSDRAFIYERGFSLGAPSAPMFLVQSAVATAVANHPDLIAHARSALRRALARFREMRPHVPVSGPDDLIPHQPSD